MAPACRAGRSELTPNVKVQIGNAERTRAGKGLIVSQVAISLVLLSVPDCSCVGCAISGTVKAGFNRDHLLLFRFHAEANGYNDKTNGPLYDHPELEWHVIEST